MKKKGAPKSMLKHEMAEAGMEAGGVSKKLPNPKQMGNLGMKVPKGLFPHGGIDGIAGGIQKQIGLGVGISYEIPGAFGIELFPDVLIPIKSPLGKQDIKIPIIPDSTLPGGIIQKFHRHGDPGIPKLALQIDQNFLRTFQGLMGSNFKG